MSESTAPQAPAEHSHEHGHGHQHGHGHAHGGCGCGHGHGSQQAAPADVSAGRRNLGLTSARPGEGTPAEELAAQGPRPGGGCACGRH